MPLARGPSSMSKAGRVAASLHSPLLPSSHHLTSFSSLILTLPSYEDPCDHKASTRVASHCKISN